MIRIMMVIGFFSMLALAIMAFLQRETESIRQRIEVIDSPRILLERFTFYRYQGTQVDVQVSARNAHFLEPNKLEIFTDVSGFRRIEDRFEELSCQIVTAHFMGNGLADVMAKNELVRAEFDSQVEIKLREQTVKTDYAEYLARTDILRSAMPVVILGRARRLQTDSGFVYDMAQESIRLHGQVNGILHPDEEL